VSHLTAIVEPRHILTPRFAHNVVAEASVRLLEVNNRFVPHYNSSQRPAVRAAVGKKALPCIRMQVANIRMNLKRSLALLYNRFSESTLRPLRLAGLRGE